MLLLAVGGWSMMGHRSTAVPIVQADSRPIRVKPENAGGMQIAGANEDIMSGGSDTNGGKLAPPPEAPAPQALRAPPPAPRAIVAAPAGSAPAARAIVAAPLVAPAPAVAPVVAKPTPEKPVATPDKRAATSPQATTPTAKGTLVQLAAVSSEDAAKTEWQRLEKRMPDLLGNRQPAISKTERDGRELWRVRTGGFSDLAQATVFCERVRAKGTGCSVADF